MKTILVFRAIKVTRLVFPECRFARWNPDRTSLVFAIIAAIWSSLAGATNVSTGLYWQPIYLGNASQPDRIPLGSVVCNSNYGYGTYAVICEPRPSYHGHFVANGRTLSEQNLAPLFGVSLELSDETQLAGSTATFRLRSVTPPANAPYSQEQVLAASLQILLLRSGNLGKEHPLSVVVTGDGMPTPEWASKYAGKYGAESSGSDETPKPLIVPGLRLEETSPGAMYLVFEGVPANAAIKRRDPVFVPFLHEGETDNSEGILLVPVWHGDVWDEPLNVLKNPCLPYYERWSGDAERAATPYLPKPHSDGHQSRLSVERGPDEVTVSIEVGELPPSGFAALVYACALSIQPTTERPMIIKLDQLPEPGSFRTLLLADSAWDQGRKCTFVYDPATRRLAKGGIPGFVFKESEGKFFVRMEADEAMLEPGDAPPPWLSDTLRYIREKAPPVTPEDLAGIRRNSAALWKRQDRPTAGTVAHREQQIRALLVLWQFEDHCDGLECVWWKSDDRAIRALAAEMCAEKEPPRNGELHHRIYFEKEAYRFSEWEATLRREELMVQVGIHIEKALVGWLERVGGP